MASPSLLHEHVRSHAAPLARPHVTLTWAQSLDSKIAGVGGKRVILSGPESMLMTHHLRAIHDSILIGVHTLVLDDPRLQTNLLPPTHASPPPQPLILDPSLRFPLTSRILNEWNTKPALRGRTLKQPWILCGSNVSSERINEVEQAGARVVPLPLDSSGRIPPSSLPSILTSLGLRSVMIEGGSRVLSSFLHTLKRDDGSKLVDTVVVTVAPTFIGEGVGVVPEGEDKGLPALQTVHTETMGKDSVMICTVDVE
ncbi:2,5-diamino-6-(ribosylamino)-4(3H)-pyrimidinone 5'-phosphate reductase [Cryptococcus deuterogattii R265]|uniref:2,5-diamino-6-(ribosylamino)-4(3H)-pyrimidinone 5'-phosphate reductase n=1 Tax=Cryptococcus deuterogattii (strain R265) TaxID=294750 RepID=UPI001937F39F|nr:2,5-diamino-6-(ribosylamino)-4(3H)-pyrimidinone 5'-phosphate reductase [Cryptococcus deuterogattii R265]